MAENGFLVEILEQILSRLLVKYLMQLKCVCKYWLVLISSNKQFSKQCHHLITPTLMDYPLSSVLITVATGPRCSFITLSTIRVPTIGLLGLAMTSFVLPLIIVLLFYGTLR